MKKKIIIITLIALISFLAYTTYLRFKPTTEPKEKTETLNELLSRKITYDIRCEGLISKTKEYNAYMLIEDDFDMQILLLTLRETSINNMAVCAIAKINPEIYNESFVKYNICLHLNDTVKIGEC